ncbi:MAG: glycosyltransferase family 2 protein [Mycetocola sp.]
MTDRSHPGRPLISVIVPTFSTGDRIARVVDSLDAQSMPATQFEVIFVDDGSPDDTVAQLQAIAASRPNVQVHRVENTGWPSHARNVGLDLASGDYVLFMDHDDEVYPEALEAGYRLASANNADVLNGKESRTDQAKWAIDVYTADLGNGVHRDDVPPLVPTNPHKLFRRQFLLDHGIRFPEGRRILWEDVYFNLDVQRHAQVVSVLSSTPFYHWVQHGSNTSASYAGDSGGYWSSLRRVFEHTVTALDGAQRTAAREEMLFYQYRTRLLPVIGASLFARPDDEIRTALDTASGIIDDFIPAHFEHRLPQTLAARAFLLANRRWDALPALTAVDSGMVGITTTTSADWADGRLRVGTESLWRSAAGQPPGVVEKDGRLRRDLPDAVVAALDGRFLDVTDEVAAAQTTIGIRSRASAVVWMLPTTSTVTATTVDGVVDIRVSADAELDVHTAAFGAALHSGVWEFNARNSLFGVVNQRGLRSQATATGAVIGGRAAIAYRTKNGMLAIDLDQTVRSLARAGTPDTGAARVTRTRDRYDVALPIDGIHLAPGQTATDLPPGFTVENGRLVLNASTVRERGTHPILSSAGTRTVRAGASLTVRSLGRAALSGETVG